LGVKKGFGFPKLGINLRWVTKKVLIYWEVPNGGKTFIQTKGRPPKKPGISNGPFTWGWHKEDLIFTEGLVKNQALPGKEGSLPGIWMRGFQADLEICEGLIPGH